MPPKDLATLVRLHRWFARDSPSRVPSSNELETAALGDDDSYFGHLACFLISLR